MNKKALKFVFFSSLLAFSSSLLAQEIHCNADARIIAPSGDGSLGNVTGSANEDFTDTDGFLNNNGNDFGTKSKGEIEIDDSELDRLSCRGKVKARLYDPNTGKLVQMIKAQMNNKQCKIILKGRINLTHESPTDANGNCQIENRGHQISFAGQTFAISAFAYRIVQ